MICLCKIHKKNTKNSKNHTKLSTKDKFSLQLGLKNIIKEVQDKWNEKIGFRLDLRVLVVALRIIWDKI